MKVLLVKPPSKMHLISPPLSLGYLAALIKDKAEVKILDCLKRHYTLQQFAAYVDTFRPDIIGLTAFTLEIEAALQCAAIAKKINPAMLIVIGGPHASNAPQAVLQCPDVDYIFQGEAEIGFVRFIEQLQQGSLIPADIPGLGYKVGAAETQQIHLNPPQYIDELDNIPFPDHALLDVQTYPKLYLSKKHPSIPIFTSRGCPYHCTFCAGHRISGRRFRARSAENIIAEISLLRERYHAKEIQIWDDIFTLNRQRVIRFCELLKAKHWDLLWWCPNGVRLETLDYELLKIMKESGCYAIVLGIESGSERVQKMMKKNLNFTKLREVARMAKDLGIRTQGFFIIGYPGETLSDVRQTIALAKSLPLDRASFSLFQPLFGSEIYTELERAGTLPNIQFSQIEYSKPTMPIEGVDGLQGVKNLQRQALLQFYLRPRIFLRFMRETLSLMQLRNTLLLIKKYVFNR